MKCKRNERYCKALLNVIGETTQKGFSVYRTIDFKTYEHRNRGIIYKKNQKDRGFVINYCPFCGEYINRYEEGKNE